MLKGLAVASTIAAGLFGADFNWTLPHGFPRPAVPPDNPMSAGKVELGRYLFYDKRISVNGKASCGSCHRQELAFTDGRARAEGTTGQVHPRSSMSLVNVAYAPMLTWANPSVDALEEQALTPMFGEEPIELGLKGREQEFLNTLRRDPLYQRLFPQTFPETGDVYTIKNVTKAIAAFERTIISMRSPYDRYRWGGDASAISDAAKRGEILFSSSERGGCFQCHGGWNFSSIRFEGSRDRGDDDRRSGFLNTGVTPYVKPNRGLYERTQRSEDIGKFRAPTLRNIALTAPYMHDGSLATLVEVIDHYAAGGKLDHPNKSRILRPFRLSDGEKRDLVAFVTSLTDEELLHDPRWSDPWPAMSR
ncbi:MAG: methylamine utilization protein [Bryobacterales bacterium]|nr:methylamine utilization protein [Bryobacterales bacterium]